MNDEIYSALKRLVEEAKEYRKIKPYWTKRLAEKEFDEIYFKNGYSKNAPFIRVEWKGITKEKEEYVIILGKILETKNI